MHLCAGLTAASWIMEPFGEIGANFSLQLLSRTQCLLKLVIKKLSPKINVKNIKKKLEIFCFVSFRCNSIEKNKLSHKFLKYHIKESFSHKINARVFV